jgi:Xaa-Pro aminopeptidase
MFKSDIYIERRRKLKESVKEGIILIFGNNELPMNYTANTFHFRQDSNFLYFFGIDQPGLIGFLDAESGEEIIFGNEADLEDIIWIGMQETLTEKASKVGINKVLPFNQVIQQINNAKSVQRPVHFLPPYPADRKITLSKFLGIAAHEIDNHVSMELIKAVAAQREIKSDLEINEIDSAITNITHEMYLTAMKMADEGMHEYEISGTMEGIALRSHSRLAYPIICSVHGEILHNHVHENQLQKDQLLLIDAGSESTMHYASDITRTIPVNRKFTSRQKDIYEVVLNAQLYAIEQIKPGVPFFDIHINTCKKIAEGLKNLGFINGNIDDVVAEGAHAMFMPHGLGHMIGLDVHDMEDLGENNFAYDDGYERSSQFGTAYLRLGKKLKEGFVLTVEPGLYFIPALIKKWKSENKFTDFINYSKLESYFDFGGVRIEDDVAVTSNGSKVLGTPIPKTVEEIESISR